MIRRPPISTLADPLFPYPTLVRSEVRTQGRVDAGVENRRGHGTTRGRSTVTTTRRLRMRAAHETVLERGMEAIRKEMRLPDAFPPEVEEAARRAAADPRLPDEARPDLAPVRLHPPDPIALGQAMFLEHVRRGARVPHATPRRVQSRRPRHPT